MFWNKKANQIKEAANKLTNKDLLQAYTGVIALMGFVNDKKMDEAEQQQARALISGHPKLGDFGMEAAQMFDAYVNRLKNSFMSGKREIMRELGDVKGDQVEMEDVLVASLDMAMLDGVFQEAEYKLASEVATLFRLNLDDYLEDEVKAQVAAYKK